LKRLLLVDMEVWDIGSVPKSARVDEKGGGARQGDYFGFQQISILISHFWWD